YLSVEKYPARLTSARIGDPAVRRRDRGSSPRRGLPRAANRRGPRRHGWDPWRSGQPRGCRPDGTEKRHPVGCQFCPGLAKVVVLVTVVPLTVQICRVPSVACSRMSDLLSPL